MSSSSSTDPTQWLEAARAGDPRALAQLLEGLQAQVYRFGVRMCRHAEDAEDVLQDTLLTVARKLHQYRGASSLSTWVYAIARSHCLKKRRRSKFAPTQHEQVTALDGEAGEVASSYWAGAEPFVAVAHKEAWARVSAAMASLDPESREVLLLRDVEGLSAAEAAEVVGSSVPALKSRLHRARKALREALDVEATVAVGCPDIALAFSRHHEGELTPDACKAMEEHVASCPRCRGVCDALQDDLRICGAAPDEPVPEDVQARIRAALRDVS